MRIPTLSWDESFLVHAATSAMRSKDASTQCGAIIVKDKVILSTGFNGPPSELIDDEIPWEKRPEKYAYIMHAEENALWFAVGGWGFDKVKGSSVYCTHEPCSECVLRMIRCGVKEVVIPETTPPYPMSKYQVNPQDLIWRQRYPKLDIRRIMKCTPTT